MKNPIKLQFLGAFAGVTGSKTLIECKNRRYLVDCGLFQGPKPVRQMNWDDFPIKATTIDAVFLTHAHLDHVGYLPRLYRQGFRGLIYCSEGTYDLAQIILMDSAYLEEEAAKYAAETQYSNHKEPMPLFTVQNAEDVLKLFQAIPRYTWFKVSDDLSIRLLRAGHIIGASMVQVMSNQDHRSHILSFSGDIGHDESMILKGPDALPETDVLVLESTYGDRLHDRENACDKLGVYLKKAIDRKGVVIIPAFAVGRSQELIYMIGHLERKGIIPPVPVILDSPMSERALDIFFSHEEDQTVGSSFRTDPDSFFPQKFETSATPDQSMLTTMMDGPAIAISASGMLSGGRILHHLKHRLGDPNNMVIFTGYQAEGTKGRFLQDNSGTLKSLRIHHQEVEVRAEIVTIGNLSAHADYEQMLQWLRKFPQKPKQVLLNHGSPEAQVAWAQRLEKELGWTVKSACMQANWEF